MSADNNELIPYTYRRNYEELVGLFATSNNKNNDIKKNYENDFINNKEFQIKNIVENFTNYLENSNLTIEDIKKQVEKEAKKLWEAGITGVQKGKLDDRPLYWARNKMQVALKRYYLFKNDIDFEKSIVKKNSNLEEIIITFEEKSRNYTGIDFSKAPKGTKKILITGFDPFILNEFNNKEIKGYSPNIKQSNPSGVVALALNGNTELGGYIQTMIVPVRYTDFDSSQDRKNGQGKGIIEKYIKPFIEKKGEVDMIITISQADAEYNIDVFATATRRGFNDNMNFIREDGSKAIPGGAETIKTTLPKKMVDSKLGTNYNGRYFITKKDFDDCLEGDDCSKEKNLDINDDLPQLSIYYGPGGNYLSNEIFYRVAKLRESLQPKLPTGHFHIRKIQGVKEELVPEKVEKLITIIKETIKNALQH